jgi:hypothetical protein
MHDYTLAIKSKGRPSKPWRWEIYEPGKNKPVLQSEFFETMSEATRLARRRWQNSEPTEPLDALRKTTGSAERSDCFG